MTCGLAPFASRSRLSDHPIRSCQNVWWDGQSDLFGGLEIDHELKLRWLLHGEIRGPGAFENLVDVNSGTAEQVSKTRRVGKEPTRVYNSGCEYTDGRRFFVAWLMKCAR